MGTHLAALLMLLVPLSAADVKFSGGLGHFYNLEYQEAIADFRKDIVSNPDVAANYNHLAMAILYREMFRSGALESELVSGRNPFLRRAKMNPSAEDQRHFDESIAKAIELSD